MLDWKCTPLICGELLFQFHVHLTSNITNLIKLTRTWSIPAFYMYKPRHDWPQHNIIFDTMIGQACHLKVRHLVVCLCPLLVFGTTQYMRWMWVRLIVTSPAAQDRRWRDMKLTDHGGHSKIFLYYCEWKTQDAWPNIHFIVQICKHNNVSTIRVWYMLA